MKSKVSSLILATSLLITVAAGAWAYNVREIKDEFDGYTINRMVDNWVSSEIMSAYNFMDPAPTGIFINPQVLTNKDGTKSYSINLILRSYSGWIYIGKGETLVFLIDGQRLGLSGEGSINHRSTGSYNEYLNATKIIEEAWYTVTPDTLRKIADAKEAKFKIQGQTVFITATLSDENKANISRFLKEYGPVENASGSATASRSATPASVPAVAK